MEQIDIDNTDENYSNEGILKSLKYYIEHNEIIYDEQGIEVTKFEIIRYVCIIIMHLTDENILNHTINYLKTIGLLKDADEKFKNLKQNLISTYTEIDLIKIKAILYSLTAHYELNIKALKPPKSKEPNPFNITLRNRTIEHNMDEIIKQIQQEVTLKFVNDNEILPIEEQKKAIDSWITNIYKINYSKSTTMFCDDIIFLKGISEHLVEPTKNNNYKEQKVLTVESILKEQNKLLPKISVEEVFNHFKTLTTSTNKNSQFYLTNEQLLIFINSTFIEQKPIKQKFNCEGIYKKDLRKIFYNFYFNNKLKETNLTRLKRKYFNIMNEGFEGFTENDYTDFAK